MDPWKELAAREECRDTVRAWAALEGKTPQMADDLARQYCRPKFRLRNWQLAFGVGVKLAAWWWQITRR